MKAINLVLAGALVAGIFTFTSCDKSESFTPSMATENVDVTEQQAALDEIVESVFDELDAVLASDPETAGIAQLKSVSAEVGCPTVIVDTPEDARYPKVITFDYGTENCEDRFGRLKRGKVIVTKSGPHWEAGSERTVEFEDFYVNDNKVDGTRKYKNEGTNVDGNWEFSVNIDVTVETVEETTCTHKAERIRTMIAGADTPRNVWDDEFLVTGTSSGTCSLGYSVEREITTPIYLKRVCRFPVSGVVQIVRTIDEVSKTIYLNYGSGECDYTATITDETGAEKVITLGKRFKK